jgi:aspartyl-tRNA(Asn)/glutamyl-tRNA(Gln) amidotransferase subunit C
VIVCERPLETCSTFAKLHLVSKTAVPIKHIAKLAHLQLTEDQLQTYSAKLESILEHMQEITQLNLSDVPSTARVIEEENIFRDDVVLPSLPQAEALKNATKTQEGFFVVPGVLKDQGD